MAARYDMLKQHYKWKHTLQFSKWHLGLKFKIPPIKQVYPCISSKTLRQQLPLQISRNDCSSPESETPPVKKANMSDKLPPDLKLLYDSLSQKWDERIDPLKSKVNALFSEESKLPRHNELVKEMKLNQGKLESRLNMIEKENVELKQKLTEIEDQMLENCVVLTGLNTDKWENPEPRRSLIDKELATILPGVDEEEKLANARAIKIVKIERIGCFNPTKGRPIAIKFAFKSDADWILSCKKKLKTGIFIDIQYSDETEYERRHLRPILAAAHKLEEYCGKCKLEGTDIIIKGKKYNWNKLHDLPQNLSTHTVSSRQDASYYGFFGELNPLSNFYPALFIHEGIHYSQVSSTYRLVKLISVGTWKLNNK